MQGYNNMESVIRRQMNELACDDVVLVAVSSCTVELVNEIADGIHCSADFVITGQIEAPRQAHICIGAVAEDKVFVLNEEAVAYLDIDNAYIKAQIFERAAKITKIRERIGAAKLHNLSGKHVILVTEEMKTGIRVLAALKYLNYLNAADILVIAGRASKEAVYFIENQGARVISVETTSKFDLLSDHENDFEDYQLVCK